MSIIKLNLFVIGSLNAVGDLVDASINSEDEVDLNLLLTPLEQWWKPVLEDGVDIDQWDVFGSEEDPDNVMAALSLTFDLTEDEWQDNLNCFVAISETYPKVELNLEYGVEEDEYVGAFGLKAGAFDDRWDEVIEWDSDEGFAIRESLGYDVESPDNYMNEEE